VLRHKKKSRIAGKTVKSAIRLEKILRKYCMEKQYISLFRPRHERTASVVIVSGQIGIMAKKAAWAAAFETGAR